MSISSKCQNEQIYKVLCVTLKWEKQRQETKIMELGRFLWYYRKLRLHSWLEDTPTLVPWLHFLLLCLVRCLWVECLYSLFLSCAQLSSFLPAGDLLFWTLAALCFLLGNRSWEEGCLLEAPGRIQQITNPQYQKQEIYEWMSKAVCMWYGIYYLTV